MGHETVPIDRRWLGMDTRGIPYAVVALVLMVTLHWVAPAIDDAVSWDNPVEAGDVLDLGGGIRITPPVGWQLEDGVRVSDETVVPLTPDGASAVVANGSVTIRVNAATWEGTASELMDQYNRVRDTSDEEDDRLFAVTGERQSFTTDTGITGVQESYTSLNGEGRAFAFVVEATNGRSIGVVVSASGSDASVSQFERQIDALAASLTTTGDGA